ncbi:MAG: lipid A biosynthesis acyltransferase [Proteobacteria bacterium]|nr:lipid A biosynthesis acyltransferase [Pseudomonadota bacterium]
MRTKDSNKDRHRFKIELLHPRHWLTWIGLGFYFIFTLLPLSLVDDIGCRLGRFAASKNKKRFNIAVTNLSLCFPEKSPAEIKQMALGHFQAQFRSVLHYFILWWRPLFIVRKKIVRSGFEQIDDYREQGKNVIILLVHSVGLDFANPAITPYYNTVAPYKKMRNPVIDWLIAKARLRFSKIHGGKLFSREDGLRPLIREVRAGNILVYLADEDLGEKHSIFVPFYGVPKATLPVLGRLAQTCNAVVLPCVSCYEPDKKRYEVKLLPKIEEMPSGDDMVDSLKMNAAIESAIDECPVQYFWTLRYFQTRPPGEASVYD